MDTDVEFLRAFQPFEEFVKSVRIAMLPLKLTDSGLADKGLLIAALTVKCNRRLTDSGLAVKGLLIAALTAKCNRRLTGSGLADLLSAVLIAKCYRRFPTSQSSSIPTSADGEDNKGDEDPNLPGWGDFESHDLSGNGGGAGQSGANVLDYLSHIGRTQLL